MLVCWLFLSIQYLFFQSVLKIYAETPFRGFIWKFRSEIQVLMGVLMRVNAVAFVEDIPINMTEWEQTKYSPAYIDEKFAMVSTNCFIAAGIYLLVLIFAAVQLHLNTRHNYSTP